MNVLVKEHRDLLLAMLKHDVSFMLIGGYAVIYYGYERSTGDMDIWIKPDNNNRDKLLKALMDFGIDDIGIEQLSKADFTASQTFFFGVAPRRIDFLVFAIISSVSYDEASKQVKYFTLQDNQVPVIQYHHLITTKMLSGRLKDQADVEELQRVKKYNKDK